MNGTRDSLSTKSAQLPIRIYSLRAVAVTSRAVSQALNGCAAHASRRLLTRRAKICPLFALTTTITKGVDHVTLDGFSQQRVQAIIARLRNGTYRFQPVRRVYIPKKRGKKRPLGISSGDDKLVQEVVRLILERIYEPIFADTSHGFRPGRSPHTALQQIGRSWESIKWVVDMDIRDYFTTIPHDLLMGLLSKKIEDTRFLGLIQAMLDAGYLEDWT
jgi:retron-type reverse transcriptase